jgi:opine dehydrogenase
MDVAILGSGPVGCATAAVATQCGHAVRLVRPRGEAAARLRRLRLEGAVEADIALPFAEGIEAVDGARVVVLAVPATAYRDVLPALTSVMRPEATVIFSGGLSLAPLWLSERLPASCGVVAWGTTLATASFLAPDVVRVGTVRARFDVAPLPPERSQAALDLCTALFGDRFDLAQGGVLASALSNINPIAHAAQVLTNLSRIDRAETWPLFGCFTESGAGMCLAMDAERLALAKACGVAVRSIEAHYHLSYHVPQGPLAGMAAAMQARGLGPHGPTTLSHRYIDEDMPFGLAFLEALGAARGVPTPALSGALTLLAAAAGRDLRRRNWLLPELRLGALSGTG